MDHEEYCARTEAQINRMATVAGGTDPGTPVPTCPEWDLTALIRHTGIVHRWATAIVATRATEPVSRKSLDMQVPSDPAGYPQWLADGAAPLAAALRDAGPDIPVWAWGDDPRTGWWARRMLHETTVHRADAEVAAGLVPRVDPVAAADGIDEFLANILLGGRPSKRIAELRGGQSIHLHATDAGLDGTGVKGEWLITLADGGFTWSHDHAKATTAVRGPAAQLLLLCYGRISSGDERLTLFGDRQLFASWQDIMAL
jgi:uncharacterized protein (TIGR03083 family)